MQDLFSSFDPPSHELAVSISGATPSNHCVIYPQKSNPKTQSAKQREAAGTYWYNLCSDPARDSNPQPLSLRVDTLPLGHWAGVISVLFLAFKWSPVSQQSVTAVFPGWRSCGTTSWSNAAGKEPPSPESSGGSARPACWWPSSPSSSQWWLDLLDRWVSPPPPPAPLSCTAVAPPPLLANIIQSQLQTWKSQFRMLFYPISRWPQKLKTTPMLWDYEAVDSETHINVLIPWRIIIFLSRKSTSVKSQFCQEFPGGDATEFTPLFLTLWAGDADVMSSAHSVPLATANSINRI